MFRDGGAVDYEKAQARDAYERKDAEDVERSVRERVSDVPRTV